MPMSVRDGLLAILTLGPAYGSQLHAEFMGRAPHRKMVNVGQIYVSTSNRTAYGAAGSVTGGPTNDLTLRYLGDGLFDATATSGPAYVTR